MLELTEYSKAEVAAISKLPPAEMVLAATNAVTLGVPFSSAYGNANWKPPPVPPWAVAPDLPSPVAAATVLSACPDGARSLPQPLEHAVVRFGNRACVLGSPAGTIGVCRSTSTTVIVCGPGRPVPSKVTPESEIVLFVTSTALT